MPNNDNPDKSGDAAEGAVPRAGDLRNLKLGRPTASGPLPSRVDDQRDDDFDRGAGGGCTQSDGWVEPTQRPPRAQDSEWIDPSERDRRSGADAELPPWQRMFGNAGPALEAGDTGKPPGHLKRVAAYLIDLAIITAVLSVIFPAVLGRPYIDIDQIRAFVDATLDQANIDSSSNAEPVTPDDEADSSPIPFINFNTVTWINLGTYILYHGVLLGLVGATVGKRLMGITVCGADGNPIGIPRGVLRSIGLFLTGTFATVAFLVIVIHPRRRGLHDLIAGSHPIERSQSFQRADQF